MPSSDELAQAFFATSHALRRLADRLLAAEGLSLARMKLLRTLLKERELRLGDLSARLGIAARTASTTVEGLVRDGYVHRQPDPSDARATAISLTAKGRSVLARGRRKRRASVESLFATLDAQARVNLYAVLELLSQAALQSDVNEKADK